MHYVYLLKSEKTGEAYIGYTTDLKSRLTMHNSGRNISTKKDRPWKMFYFEAYVNKKYALNREKNLKHYGKALGMLKRRIGFVG